MTTSGLEQIFHAHLERLDGLGAIVCFELGPDGTWVIDARSGAPALIADIRAADCVITIGGGDLIELFRGRLDPMAAYARGQVKVSGSLNVAMRLAALLG
ncbi:MAG: SCP2 sterol-binding domain-containing protein [Magnetospirillum sp.]|nr:SCP2 sterol-binding domain-containing protein [Magnetospirillum sp.]